MSEKQGTHFFFMSFIKPNGVGAFMNIRRSGHVTPPQGATRHDMFDTLLTALKEQDPVLLDDAVVMSFDIQPNRL